MSGLIRGTTAQRYFRESYVARVPLPASIPDWLGAIEATCSALKRHLVALDPTERSFAVISATRALLAEGCRRHVTEAEVVAAVLHAMEAISEGIVFEAQGIEADDLQAVLDETGTPAGWFPLIAGYDAIPELPSGLAVPAELLEPVRQEKRRSLAPGDLIHLKRRLAALYEAGPRGTVVDAEDEPRERAVVGRALEHPTAIAAPVPGSADLEGRVPRSVNAFKTYGRVGYFHPRTSPRTATCTIEFYS